MIEIGDLIVPLDIKRTQLACGTGRYQYGVVISVSPFIFTSIDSTMMWQGEDIEDFKEVVKVSKKILKKCKRRLKK